MLDCGYQNAPEEVHAEHDAERRGPDHVEEKHLIITLIAIRNRLKLLVNNYHIHKLLCVDGHQVGRLTHSHHLPGRAGQAQGLPGESS
jgi:hypothetical protein